MVYSTRLHQVFFYVAAAVDKNRTDHSIDRGLNCNAVDIVFHRVMIVVVVVRRTVVAVDSRGAGLCLVAGRIHGTLEKSISFDLEFSWLVLGMLTACRTKEVDAIIVVRTWVVDSVRETLVG